MGWSCTVAVGETLERLREAGAFVKAEHAGSAYFVEVNNREYDDGRASCKLMRVVSEEPDGCMAATHARFTILPDGSMPRAPQWLRELVRH